MRTILIAAFCLASAHAFAADVSIDNFAFTPAEIIIKAGESVTWTNRDDIPHTVTDAAHPPGFRSQALDTDDQVSFKFDKAGTYRYFCSLHPHMQATVVVR